MKEEKKKWFENRIDNLYFDWIMEFFPEEIKSREDVTNKFNDGYKYDEFVSELNEVL